MYSGIPAYHVHTSRNFVSCLNMRIVPVLAARTISAAQIPYQRPELCQATCLKYVRELSLLPEVIQGTNHQYVPASYYCSARALLCA